MVLQIHLLMVGFNLNLSNLNLNVYFIVCSRFTVHESWTRENAYMYNNMYSKLDFQICIDTEEYYNISYSSM